MDYSILLYLSCVLVCVTSGCIFGNISECALPCRCENDMEQCDAVTGSCVSGCKQWEPSPAIGTREFDWSGPGCTIGNIALGKSAEQSGYLDPNTNADKAVDGILKQEPYVGDNKVLYNCAHTNSYINGNAWWRVDLGELHVVLNFTIFNRFTSGYRTGYFTVGVGNTSINGQHSECVRYDGEIPDRGSRTFVCTQPLIGRYVSLVRYGGREPNILNFCEMVIMGYKVITAACTHCSSTCDNIRGCQDCEYRQPPYCNDACQPGTYGISCRSSCSSHHCSDGYTACHPVNGSCLNGCDNWSKGSKCDIHINEAYLNQRSGVQVTVINDHSIKLVWQAATGIKPELDSHYGYIGQRKSATGFQDVFEVPHQAGVSNYSAVIDQLQENTDYTFRLSLFRQFGGLTELFPQYIDGINATTACVGYLRDIKLHIIAYGTPYFILVGWKRRCDNIWVTTLYYRQVGKPEWTTHEVPHPLITTLVQLPIDNLVAYEVKLGPVNNAGQTNETLHVVQPPSSDDPFLELTIVFAVLSAACLVAVVSLLVFCLRQKKAHNDDKKQDSHSMGPVGTSGEYCTPSTVPSNLTSERAYDVIRGDKTDEEEPKYEAI